MSEHRPIRQACGDIFVHIVHSVAVHSLLAYHQTFFFSDEHNYSYP